MKRLVIALALSLLSYPTFAVILTHGSSGGVFTQCNGGCGATATHFDRAEFTFASEYADTITIGNTGTAAIFHTHSTTRNAEVDVFDGTNWVNVFAFGVSGGTNVLLSTIFSSAINFSGMNISGLRLDVSAQVNQAYHFVSSAMTYTTSGTPVPEPATIAILGLGLAGLGFRSRKKKAG